MKLVQSHSGESPKRILVVDDVEDVRLLVRATLQKSIPALSIDEAESGFVASVKLAKNSYDAVVSDVQMLNGNGLWLHYFMRDYHPATPLLFFTASPDAVLPLANEPLRFVVCKDRIQALVSALNACSSEN